RGRVDRAVALTRRRVLPFTALSSGSGRGRRIELSAAAKVNLALEILGRRADGYHEIVTVMQAVELADRIVLEDSAALELRIAGDARLGRRGPSPATSCGSQDIARDVPKDASNLAMRAALAL